MENNEFKYTYSAQEQEEIKAIRKKYVKPEKQEDDMTKLRRLDESVTQKATIVSLIIGILGALVLGSGMSLVLTDLGSILSMDSNISIIIGIVIGILGIVLVSIAYPIYNMVLKIERKKIAPEIIRLTDELMK